MAPLPVALLVLVLLTTVPAAAQAAAPANDDFANAVALGVPDTETGTNVDATMQPGEVDPNGSEGGGHSVWYTLTTATTQPVRVDTCGSQFDSSVAVYTGDSVDALTELDHSQHACAGGGVVAFEAAMGTTYRIGVTVHLDDAGPGSIVIHVGTPSPPANDDFADAEQVFIPQTVAGTNVDATLEAGEPEPIEFDSGHSVWYRLTMNTTQPVRLDTCGGGLDTVLAVYTGTSVDALTEVGSDDDGCDVGGGSVVDFVPVPGTTYRIAVRGFDEATGDFVLTVGSTPPPPPPPPPPPSCPPAGSPAGAVTYQGTHSAGGPVCLTVLSNFSAVSSFHVVDAPGDICTFGFALDRFNPALPIANRAFSTARDSLNGAFSSAHGVQGSFRITRSDGFDTCTSDPLTFSATTTATPPWAGPPPRGPDTTAPVVRLDGATIQRPLRTGAITVRVRCTVETCTARASTTVARASLRTPNARVRTSEAKRLRLVLSSRARRAIRSALRRHATIRARIAVTARDAAGNRRTARRLVTLKR